MPSNDERKKNMKMQIIKSDYFYNLHRMCQIFIIIYV